MTEKSPGPTNRQVARPHRQVLTNLGVNSCIFARFSARSSQVLAAAIETDGIAGYGPDRSR
jgi:hypothetical protein